MYISHHLKRFQRIFQVPSSSCLDKFLKMKRHQVALECVEISVKVKKSLKPVKRSTLIIDMKKCLIMVDSWVLKIKDIKEGGLLQEPRNTLTLKGNGKVIVCIVADTDDEIDMLDDFVDNKIVPSIQVSPDEERRKAGRRATTITNRLLLVASLLIAALQV